MPLPPPQGRQREVVYLPADGNSVVLGTAGSGKTLMAIWRAAHLGDPSSPEFGATLLVTFNTTLVTYLKHLRPPGMTGVTVETYHKFGRGYLAGQGVNMDHAIIDGNTRRRLIGQAVDEIVIADGNHRVFERPIRFLESEIEWIEANGLATVEEYLAAERTGRSAHRMLRRDREPIFLLLERYRRLRTDSGKKYDWDDLASAVRGGISADGGDRRYRHVVIDEGQDFSPEMLRSLSAAVPANGSVTWFGDYAQQIYGQRMSWRQAGIENPRIWRFKENYRNSRQIAQLALRIAEMPYFSEVSDLVEPSAPVAEGPSPVIRRFRSEDEELGFVARFAEREARTKAVAVLFRDRELEKRFGRVVTMAAIRLHRDMRAWSSGPGLHHGTYHSAKGLEFDMVILPFLSSDRLPVQDDVAAFGRGGAMAYDGKLLYVGVTRARSELVLTYSGDVTELLVDDDGGIIVEAV